MEGGIELEVDTGGELEGEADSEAEAVEPVAEMKTKQLTRSSQRRRMTLGEEIL